jgi:hypothetical protein
MKPDRRSGRQRSRSAKERADLVKATRTVVDFVGTVEMPVWDDENKQSVEGHAVELRHRLRNHMHQRGPSA